MMISSSAFSVMKVFWFCVLIFVAVIANSQTGPGAAEAHSHLSIADFGLSYPLSNDWVKATELLRKKIESDESPRNFDVLLAAVYVPKSNVSTSSPFFSLLAYRQPATDCKKSLEATITESQDKKDRPEGGVVEFSAAGREYFRLNQAHGIGGRHQFIVCTVANDHLLVWHAGAPKEKELDTIVATLDSITPLPQKSAVESTPSSGPKDGTGEAVPLKAGVARPERVRVSSGVSSGLLIKKVNPNYPEDARAAYIQGTVVLKAEISKSGDITNLELIDGPLELAGSAVAAVRQWKYKPYLLMGEPVTVDTQIQVNYQLR
jgi:TonB family protein